MIAKNKITTVDEYISTFPQNIQTILEKVRYAIQKELPESKEKIAYDIPTFEINGINVVSFAGWKKYISLYPIPAGDKVFQEKIQQYRNKKAKRTLQFPLEKPIPYELVSKTVMHLKKEKM